MSLKRVEKEDNFEELDRLVSRYVTGATDEKTGRIGLGVYHYELSEHIKKMTEEAQKITQPSREEANTIYTKLFKEVEKIRNLVGDSADVLGEKSAKHYELIKQLMELIGVYTGKEHPQKPVVEAEG